MPALDGMECGLEMIGKGGDEGGSVGVLQRVEGVMATWDWGETSDGWLGMVVGRNGEEGTKPGCVDMDGSMGREGG